MRRLFGFTMSAILGLGVISCSKEESDEGSSGHRVQTGCMQGVIINGLTGDRLDLAAPTDDLGLFVLVQNKLKSFSPLTVDPAAPNMRRGEYTLCDIPLDESFPVMAWFDTFAPYESTVIVDSTRAARSGGAEYDLVKPVPTRIFNIAVFPKAQDVQDLTFNVYHNAAPLKDATVYLRPTGRNFLDPTSEYMPADNVRTKPLTGTTDENGAVTFAAADIVLGGRYVYTVLPPNGGEDHTAASDVFTVGLRETATTDTTEPFVIHVNLDHTLGALVPLSTSNDNNDPNPKGSITVYYNREIQLVPGTVDQATATLTGNVTAALKAPIADNNKSDELGVKIEGNVLTLTPVWETKPDTVITNEINLQITYQGIQIRPANSPEQASDRSETFTVGFYR